MKRRAGMPIVHYPAGGAVGQRLGYSQRKTWLATTNVSAPQPEISVSSGRQNGAQNGAIHLLTESDRAVIGQ